MTRLARLLYVALLVSFFTPYTASAQIAGALNGRVTDPSGAALSGAKIALIPSATAAAQSATTTAEGYFVFTNENPGTYTVTVRAPGFRVLERKGITLSVGHTVHLDLVLTLGAGSETVTVNEDAPPLQSETSDIETNISGRTILAMPLNSRNFILLSQIAPGVELPPGQLLPRINGGRPRTNEYLFDGISALQPEPGQVAFFPLLDDIAEFTVQANNVPAEFGRFNGGVVNVATRSGSNEIHGSVFEYFRNEDLNARNYFSRLPASKPEYRRNLYGATFGAPILKDRLFFFGDYQGIKQLIGVTKTSTVPTCAERLGNFSGVAKIYDPLTHIEFPSDTINRPFDIAAQALLARIPAPSSCTALTSNYVRTANDADHQNQFDVRLDATITPRDRAFGRYSYYHEVEQPVTPFPEGSGAISGSVLGSNNPTGLLNVTGQQIVLNEAHTFTPHLVNDLRAGYTRRGNTTSGPSLGDTASAALGIPGIPTNAAFNNALPLFTFSNSFQQIGPTASTFAQYQTSVYEVVEMLVWSRGAHVVKAGGDLRWYQLNTISPPNPTGSFAFTTTGTDQSTAASKTTGNAFASFLLGQVDTFSIDLQVSKIRPRDHIQEYFVQDDWKLRPNVTLNLGVRWTLASPSTEKTNQGAIFNLQTQQLDYLGRNGFSKSARELHWGNFAPRIGLAYGITPKTVVRSGFGIVFFDQSGITTPFTTPQFPFIQNVQQKTLDSLNAAFTLSSGPTVAPIAQTADAGLGQSVYTANRHDGSGYSQQWNLALQHSITNHLSVEVAYVGSHIVHVGIPDSNLNQLTAQQLSLGATYLNSTVSNPCYGRLPLSSSLGAMNTTNVQALKPYPCFQNVATYRHNSGETNYQGAEIKVEQKTAYGLTMTFAYTHSKLIDDASSVFSSTVLSSPNANSLIAADTFNPRLERDSSSGDMPNVTSLSAVYALPVGSGHRFGATGIQRWVLSGWMANGILTLQSGMPVAVVESTNGNAAAGFALQRPNISGDPQLPSNQRTTAHFFNTAAFTSPGTFAIGNASRNPVRGPAYRDLDVALVKITPLPRKWSAEFRAEIFNLANTPAFGLPNGSRGGTTFGQITTTVAENRVAQFALKLTR